MKSIVLFVDDDIRLLKAVQRNLRKEPYDVLIADNPLDALKILAGIKVQVIVSDHFMPGMNGVEFCAIVSKEFPNCTRIMLSGAKDFKITTAAINSGKIFRFLLKPCTAIELAIHVREALEFHKQESEKSLLLDKSNSERMEYGSLEKKYPGITSVKRTDSGSIVIDDT